MQWNRALFLTYVGPNEGVLVAAGRVQRPPSFLSVPLSAPGASACRRRRSSLGKSNDAPSFISSIPLISHLALPEAGESGKCRSFINLTGAITAHSGRGSVTFSVDFGRLATPSPPQSEASSVTLERVQASPGQVWLAPQPQPCPQFACPALPAGKPGRSPNLLALLRAAPLPLPCLCGRRDRNTDRGQ